ncbi:prepilin-type N-terminal cleavage/methylation domain-containing protein [Idiomarina xiamenensis]|uniref:Type II secretory pathway, pseudopilin n=1 Tax=Idiomarina xiamenensis 10-D-4 TaxID=740709 RepID=K2JPG6_9GAMM|nr:prepilin-type N-terminal cleavage/methylation domain-containing protein [Idiomarina xiamenensis]EKE85401.1 Type II secretory pathway, pseudopilin [Idiomarina xiamenensis 10-D-4]
MRKQQGFTLIELIIVIVILGILAVTAAPQFMNFSSDARASTVKGLEGSTKAASQMVHAKALISDDRPVEIDEENTTVEITADTTYAAATEAGIVAALDLGGDWDNVVATADEGNVETGDLLIYPNSVTETGDATSACFVYYRAATATTKPVISSVTSGCE